MLPAAHPPVAAPKVGVLLVNLGTPAAPTAASVKTYLAEFLSDRRIVDYPRALWLPLLHGVILNTRPAKTARAYRMIWRVAENESPLRYFTRRQASLLGQAFGENSFIDWAMRYGEPSVRAHLDVMRKAGCDRILVIPLYPQYSATTTASVHDAVFAAIETMRWQPALRLAPAFHDDPIYVDALAATARRRLSTLDWTPERIVISFHGLPERYLTEGDPYHCHCQKTARLLREKMGWSEGFAPLAFQSRFGREKWLGPATDETIERLAREGVKRLAVIMPGFVCDCIETLEEIGIVGREQFFKAGGATFDAIPCLNDEPEMIALLESIVRREASGWLD
ncbi:MAG: ferrochelatase [Pseudomonadota bacterium]|nr:ferrochelatase [Pseudomonadota bacterium]